MLYLSGHLHRDVSLGNTLMTDEPVKKKKFEIPEGFREHLESLQDKEAVRKINELCSKVEELVARLGISDQCTGFITDGDLSITWRDYWTKERRQAKSVGHFHITRKAALDASCRAHPSSCPGHSLMPSLAATYIRLWTTWSRSSGLRSGAYSSTKIIQRTNQSKRRL